MNELRKAVNAIEAILFQSMPFSELAIQVATLPSTSDTLSHLHQLLQKTPIHAPIPAFSEDMDIHCFTAYEDGTVCLDAVFGTEMGVDLPLRIFGRFLDQEEDLVLEVDEVMHQEKILFSGSSMECSRFWEDCDAGVIVHAEPLERFDIHVETEPRRKLTV